MLALKIANQGPLETDPTCKTEPVLCCTGQGAFPVLSDEWCKMATALGRIADISEAEVGGTTQL